MGLSSTNDSEAAGIIENQLRAAIAVLEAEVERLQRENGALARTYALTEEKLRERTGEVERLKSGQHTINIAGTSPETAHTVTVTCGLAVKNERLRAALEQIAGIDTTDPEFYRHIAIDCLADELERETDSQQATAIQIEDDADADD
jgi:hypothetical protein